MHLELLASTALIHKVDYARGDSLFVTSNTSLIFDRHAGAYLSGTTCG
jgi:hypothetical protein